jgi:hypothetical protein
MINASTSNFDLSGWPVVRYRMPDHVPDDQAEAQIAEFQAILARNERFAMIFWGPLKPAKSKHFMRLYGAWFKKNKEAQTRLCAGAVRLEPDEQRRRSFALRALAYANNVFMPYPYKVVGSDAEALQQAREWLAASPKSK